MDTQIKPEMRVFQTGDKFKVLKVKGLKGAVMPSHFSTKEAVIIVLEGEAILNLSEKQIHLKAKDSAIIPANEIHTLQITETLLANVIMEMDSDIKFEGNNSIKRNTN